MPLGRLSRQVSLAFVLAIVACASAPGGDPPPASLDITARLFARAYRQVEEYYLEPVPAGIAAAAALQRISQLDPKLAVVRDGAVLELRRDGRMVARYPRPADGEPLAWGVLTSRVLHDAKAQSDELGAMTEDKLQESLIEGVLQSLDRFSRYFPPESAREQRASRDGFSGIGVTIDYSNNEVRVTSVLPESPAARAGMKAEDRIARIDGVDTAALSRADVVRRLRGPVDSRVDVTVSRLGAQRPVELSMTRSLIVVPTVKARHEDGVAIYKITSFNNQTTQQLADEVALARKRMGAALHGIVLDLRGNPGGLLDQSVGVADLFLTDGPIVSTRGRNPDSIQSYRAAPDDVAQGLPVVVLVNGGSASAAEIVAAALQDAGRAVVVGSSSYGKGTVQTVIRLPNDGEMTLTWAKLLTPAGYVLHEHGVVPTICTSGISDKEPEIAAALRRGLAAPLASTPAGRPRATLDDRAWVDLRKTCPAVSDEHGADLQIAKRLLGSAALYARALHPEGPSLAHSGERSP